MKHTKNFKRILGGVALAAITATTTLASDLRLANFMSPNHPYEEPVFKAFASRVAELTNNNVSVEIFSGGELGPGPVEQYNRVVDGVAEFVFTLPGYTASNFPKTLLMELPGVIDEATGTQAVWNGIEHIEDEYRRTKLVAIWTNGQNVLYSNKPINSIEDMDGLKVRVPSRNAGALVESWGATAVSMPAPAIFNALQTGVIDAAFIDSTATNAFKLIDAADYITTGMASSISPFVILMNRDAFEDLSVDEQKAVEQAGREISLIANTVQLAGAKAGLEKFNAATGKQVITLSAEAAAKFDANVDNVVQNIVSALEADKPGAKAFVDALQAN